MQEPQQNILAARVTVTMTAALGAITGLLLGCVLAIPLAENHLKTYMERVAAQDDASLKEARSVLDSMQHSADPACSAEELSNLRELVFLSNYLKAAGRIQRGRIECSTTAGRPARPFGNFKAGRVQADGTVIYSNLAPVEDQNLKRTGIQLGNAFVVFGAHLPEPDGQMPIQLAIDPYQAGNQTTSSKVSPEPSSDQATSDVALRGSTIVASQCSPLMSRCVVTTVVVDDARRAEVAVIGSTTIACAIAGVFHIGSLHDNDLNRILNPHRADVETDRFFTLRFVGRRGLRILEFRRPGSSFPRRLRHNLFFGEGIFLVPGLHHRDHGYGHRQIDPSEQ